MVENGEIGPHKYSHFIFVRGANGERIVSQQIVLEKLVIHIQKILHIDVNVTP